VFPTGRLGNQLYFGAMALAVQRELKSSGRKNKIIIHSEYGLPEVSFLLGIKINKVVRNRTFRRILGKNRLRDSNIFLRAIHKISIFRYQVLCQKLTQYEDISRSKMKARIVLSESKHDYRYYKHIKDQISDHHVHSGLTDLTAEYFSNSQLSNRIAVHMRFGDYLEPHIARQYGNLDKNYYSRALLALSCGQNFETLGIQLFSDDLGKGIELLKEIGITNVSTLESFKLPPEHEVFLMSNFSQLVLSNSTFSWWAGYLAPEASRVVAPNPLMRLAESNLSRSPNWIYVDGWS